MTTSVRTTEPVASSHLDLPPPALDAGTRHVAARDVAAAPGTASTTPSTTPVTPATTAASTAAAADASRDLRRRACMIGGILFATIAVAVADRLLSPSGPDAAPFAVLALAAIAAAAASIALGVTAVRLSDDSPDDDAPPGPIG